MKGRRQAAVPIGILQLRTTAASRSGLGAGDVFGLDRVVNATQPPGTAAPAVDLAGRARARPCLRTCSGDR
jgi:hypothetical protein